MDLTSVNLYVSLEQLAYILILTIIVGSIIRGIASFFSNFSVTDISWELGAIVEKCYSLFPIENINFKGKIFKRGMKVRVTMQDNRKIEGEIIGANTENVICLLTAKFIITREIARIVSMEILA